MYFLATNSDMSRFLVIECSCASVSTAWSAEPSRRFSFMATCIGFSVHRSSKYSPGSRGRAEGSSRNANSRRETLQSEVTYGVTPTGVANNAAQIRILKLTQPYNGVL